MELQYNLLHYLDNRRFLALIKTECEKFIEGLNEETISKFPCLRFILELDLMDLLDTFPEVGVFLIEEPLKFQRKCMDILFASLLSTNGEIIQLIRPAQCVTLIRIKSLSRFLIRPNDKHYNGLVNYEGVLISVSKPLSYVHQTVWCCPEECEENEVILNFIPKIPPKCYICRSVLYENSGLRKCGEQITAIFKIKNRLHGKSLTITDDLIGRLELGSKYSIIAVVLKTATFVWSLEEVLPLPAPLTSVIPKDILELYGACNGMPWKFIYCLASSIGVNVCPLNCFMHLKVILLISLCSVKANQILGTDIVHVLAAGYDTGFVGACMEMAARIADTFNFLGTTNTSVPISLIASSGGVCLMSLPLHAYNQKLTHSILAAIETGEVPTDTEKAKLKCAVWAHGMDFKKILLYNVASVFGTVCRGDFCEYTDEIADFMLQQAIEPSDTNFEEKQAMKDIARYIDLVAGIEVKLDSSAEDLLKSYFLAARKEGPRGVTVGSMRALVALCVTSARLCRRPVANVEDAVLAVWLHASGCPEPRFAPEEYLRAPGDIKKLQKMINSFKQWLEQFTGCPILNDL